MRDVEVGSCRRITASGTYRLTGDIRNVSSGPCLNVTADNVTIDGDGYTVDGTGSGAGIRVVAGTDGVTVRNVTLTRWDEAINATNATDLSVDGVGVADIDNESIDADGSAGLAVTDATFANVSRDAITADNSTNASVDGATVTGVGGNGVAADDSSNLTVTDTTFENVSTDGIIAVDAANLTVTASTFEDVGIDAVDADGTGGAVINDNVIDGAGGEGIKPDDGQYATVVGNVINDTGDDGVETDDSPGTVVADNVITNTGNEGIEIDSARNMTARNNRLDSIDGEGIDADNNDDGRTVVVGNEITDADDEGIEADSSDDATVVVVDNVVDGAGDDGIEADSNDRAVTLIRDNRVNDTNTDPGILADSNDDGRTTIVSNVVTNADYQGIEADSNDNAVTVIRGNEIGGAGDEGIDADYSDNSTVVDNAIDGTGDEGIEIDSANNVTVAGNAITGTGNEGVEADGNGVRTVVRDNRITNTVDEAVLVDSNDGRTRVVGNGIATVRDVAVEADGTENLTVTDNEIADVTRDGIDVSDTRGATVRNNAIGNASRGVVANGSVDATLADLGLDNTSGVVLYNVTGVTVRRVAVGVGGDASGTVAELSGDNVTVSGVAAPPAAPSGPRNVGGYVRVTDLSGGESVADFATAYDEAAAADANVAALTLRLRRYNGSAWVAADRQRIDPVNDTVGANVTGSFSPFAAFGTSMAASRVGEPDGSGAFDTRAGEGAVYPNATVFQGESDVALSEEFEATPTKAAGDAAGTALQLPIPADQPTGHYTDGAGHNLTVVTPRVTAFDLRSSEGEVADGQSIRRTQADTLTLAVDWNYRSAEDLELTVTDGAGTDVTNETVVGGSAALSVEDDGAFLSDPTGAGAVQINLDLSEVDPGTYTISVEGADSLTFGEASASTVVTVESVAGGGDDDEDGGGTVQEQTEEEGTADVEGEPTEAEETDAGTKVTSRAENVRQGDRVSMETTTEETKDDEVAVEAVEFTAETEKQSVSVTVTQSTDPTPDAPDFESDRGTEPGGYIDVDHDVANEEVSDVSLEFRVAKDQLGPEDDPEDVSLYRAEGEGEEVTWNELPTEQVGETETHYRFEAESPGLSNFVVGVKQAQFRIADAEVSVAEVEVREETQVVTQVTNTGGADGTFVVELVQEDETVANRSLSIAANGTRRTTFDRTFEAPGKYDLYVNDVFVAEVTVQAGTATPAATPTPTATATPTPTETEAVGDEATGTETTDADEGSSAFSPGFGPVAAVLALFAAALAARRRR